MISEDYQGGCRLEELRIDHEVVSGLESLQPLSDSDKLECESDACRVFSLDEFVDGRRISYAVLRCGKKKKEESRARFLSKRPLASNEAWNID